MYYQIVNSISQYQARDREACLTSLQAIVKLIRHPIKIYYDTLVDSKISRSVWMAYCQGFQGWAAGELINGVYVEYDGLSGNQLLFCQVIDAFLSLEPYLTEQNRHRYIPVRQRQFSDSVSKHSFRRTAIKAEDEEIEAEMRKIVKQMRVGVSHGLV